MIFGVNTSHKKFDEVVKQLPYNGNIKMYGGYKCIYKLKIREILAFR